VVCICKIPWCIYLVLGKNLKIDLLSAKQKCYECFNSIMSVTTKQRNEIVLVNLTTSNCLVTETVIMDVRVGLWQ